YCDQLAELFPGVEHLVVYIGKPQSVLWLRVPYLLKLFPNLTSLSVHGLEAGGLYGRIFLVIDAMFSLTSLDVSLHYNDNRNADTQSIFNLPDLLPRLEHLSLSLYKFGGSDGIDPNVGQ